MGQMRPSIKTPITASGMAFTGIGKIFGIMITPGSNTTEVQIYDSPDATTTDDYTLFGPAKFVAAAKTEFFPFVQGIPVKLGAYVAITGSAVSVVVYT